MKNRRAGTNPEGTGSVGAPTPEIQNRDRARPASVVQMQAMAQNPYLHLLVQSGYYDGACDYFNAQYNMWQMDPSGKLKVRMDWKGYRSGHMMYLRQEDLVTANDDIRNFIKKSTPKPNQPAKY